MNAIDHDHHKVITHEPVLLAPHGSILTVSLWLVRFVFA
jgi:hypothetical protein